MSDSQVSVELIAKVDALTSGLAEASESMKSAAEAMRGSLENIEESSEGTEKELESLAESVKTFFEFEYVKEGVELLKEGLEGIKGAFEGTVGKAEEFSLSNAKFAAMMGTSEEEAAGLSAALRGVGSSAETFEAMALRLQMRLNTNEESFKKMGVATRDADGNLLSSKDLMQSAIKTMSDYKAGADQNAFALEVFGRRASDVYDIMRVTDESVQHQIDIYSEMGVQLSGTARDSEKLEEAMNDLHTMADALAIKIGQDLMPIAQSTLEWIGTNGAAFARELGAAIVDLAKAIADVVRSLMQAVSGVAQAMSHLKSPTGVMDWLNALDLLTGEGGQGPMGAAIDKMQELGTGSDAASSAVEHLSTAWGSLMEGLASGGGTVKDKIFGVGEGSLLRIGEGTSPGDPLLDALAKSRNPYQTGDGKKSFVAPKNGPRDKSDEEAIQADEKVDLERVASAESTNAHLLAMDKETNDQFVAQARELEDAKHAIQLDALQQELQLPGRTKQEIQKTQEAIAALEQAHQDALVKIDQDGESKRAADVKKAQDDSKKAVDDEIKASNETLKAKLDALKTELAMGKLTKSEETAQEVALTSDVRKEQLERLQSLLAMLPPTTEAYRQTMEAIKKIEEQGFKDASDKAKEHFDAVNADVKSVTNAMTGPFKTAIEDMVGHGKSFGDAMKSMFADMAANFAQMVQQIIEKWAEAQITNALLASTTAATSATAQVGSLAAVGAAGAAASQASIPYIGPVLAIAAATAMEGFILGFQSLAHASGGMVLDRDQLVYAHANEMILPARISQGMQSIIANGGGSGGGGDVNLHYNVGGVTGQVGNLPAMLKTHGNAMLAFLKQARRDGRI